MGRGLVILVLTGVTRPSLSSMLEYNLNIHCRNDSFETWHITGQSKGVSPLEVMMTPMRNISLIAPTPDWLPRSHSVALTQMCL